MGRLQTRRGITLISLVITVIVLLILATVVITLAVDSNGLFSKSGDAANKWNTSIETEETALNNLMIQMDELTSEKTLVQLYDEGKLKIGDYVNYNPIAKGDTGEEIKYKYTSLGTNSGFGSTEQTYKVNTNTKWRVLGIEGEGATRHIVLISADPIKNIDGGQYYYMFGAKAYLNCITELNNISSIYGYGEGATGADSVNIEDINKITGVTVSSSGISPDVDQERVYGTPYSFKDKYTPETWVNGKTTTTVAGTCDAYSYEGNAEGLQTNETTNPETGARLYEMLFADTDSKYYWLASHSVSADSSCAAFRLWDYS